MKCCLILICILLVSWDVSSSIAYPRGIQLDVEPYVLSQWSNDTQSIANQYLDMIEQVLNITMKYDIPVKVTIPYWFNFVQISRNGVTKPLNQWVQSLCDVVVMDYRNSASQVISDGMSELSFADSIRGKVVIAVETEELPDEPTATFFNQSNQQFEDALYQIQLNYMNYSSYESLAIDHFSSWQLLNPSCQIPSNGPIRNLYVWNWAIAFDELAQKIFFNYIDQQTVNKLGVIYFESRALLEFGYQEDLKSFVQLLNQRNIQMELLSGNPEWALASNHSQALSFVQNAVNFTLYMNPNLAEHSIQSSNTSTSSKGFNTLLLSLMWYLLFTLCYLFQ
jgi:hypothetical protein